MAQNTFHVAISVNDLPTAVEYYKKILGIAPAKVKPDYAKFEIVDPPVILSLNPGGDPGKVLHLGIRYPEVSEVETNLSRTKAQGVAVREQSGTTCCYAKADKFWVHDADGLEWEMYTLLEDAEVHSIVAKTEDVCCRPAASKQGGVQSETAANSCCGPAQGAKDETRLVQIQAKGSCC